MKKIILFVALLSSALAMANRESGGPGAPKISHRCFHLDEDFSKDFGGGPGFQIDVAKTWPDYVLKISVLNRINKTLEREPVVRDTSNKFGGPLTYKGKKFTLLIMVTAAPIFEKGRTYSYGELHKKGASIKKLKCRSLGR